MGAELGVAVVFRKHAPRDFYSISRSQTGKKNCTLLRF